MKKILSFENTPSLLHAQVSMPVKNTTSDFLADGKIQRQRRSIGTLSPTTMHRWYTMATGHQKGLHHGNTFALLHCRHTKFSLKSGRP